MVRVVESTLAACDAILTVKVFAALCGVSGLRTRHRVVPRSKLSIRTNIRDISLEVSQQLTPIN